MRAQAVKQVLLGYLRVPESPDAPLDVVLNPGGAERRAERRVWNNGDGRIKLVWSACRQSGPNRQTQPEPHQSLLQPCHSHTRNGDRTQ